MLAFRRVFFCTPLRHIFAAAGLCLPRKRDSAMLIITPRHRPFRHFIVFQTPFHTGHFIRRHFISFTPACLASFCLAADDYVSAATLLPPLSFMTPPRRRFAGHAV
jgi:hypothetical protein